MRNLTLIVTDGHAPAGLAPEPLSAIARLPSAERLVARGRRLGTPSDWWLAVLESVGAKPPAGGDLALASVAWSGVSGERSAHQWFATPVWLTAALDHVRLASIVRPPDGAIERLEGDFRRDFGSEGLVLRFAPGGHGFVEFPGELRARTVNPGRLLGSDIGACFPTGPDGPYLRRVMTELQMWLHARSASSIAFNAFWIWGGGGDWPDTAGIELPRAVSDELWLQGLWHARGGVCTQAVASFEESRQLNAERLLATLSLEAWRRDGVDQPLRRLEADWLAPAWRALLRGSLATLTLYLNGRLTRAARGHCWRLWRHRRHWAET